MLLVFLVYAVSRLIELQNDERSNDRERASYAFVARASAVAVLINVIATFVVRGWLRHWWDGFAIVTALFVASMAAVGALTIVALWRAGAIGKQS